MPKIFFQRNFLLTPIDLFVLAVVLLAGLINLPHPFDVDQGLFITGAQEINEGKILYRDFWDWKQPAIYGFYFLAGRLFGFNEIGIHSFELLYQMLFCLVLLFTLKSYYDSPAIASCIPLLIIGSYYSISTQWHLTQVEALVGFPLFLCLWFAYQASHARRQMLWLFFSGLMGGVVLLFKLMFLPIIFCLWLANLIFISKDKQTRDKFELLQFCGAIGLGLLLPLGIFTAYFAHFGVLKIVYKTFFVYPPLANTESLATPDKLLERLRQGLGWFRTHFGVLIALGIIGSAISLFNHQKRLTLLFLIWLIVGLLVIFAQLVSLWEYHYVLLFVPVGVFAGKGLDILWKQLKQFSPFSWGWKGSSLALISLGFGLASIWVPLIQKIPPLARSGFALTPEKRREYQSKMYYKVPLQETAFLANRQSLPGDIYVFGNTLYYYLSGRRQAIAINGLNPITLPPELWDKMIVQLDQARPSYIFIQSEWKYVLKHRSPQLMTFLETNYQVLSKNKIGTWYILRSP